MVSSRISVRRMRLPVVSWFTTPTPPTSSALPTTAQNVIAPGGDISTGPRWYGAVYANSIYVVVGTVKPSSVFNFASMTSSDGNTWAALSSSVFGTGGAVDVAYGAGLFVAVGGGKIASSPDGSTWTLRSSPALNGWGVTYAAGLFVVVGVEGSVAGHQVLTSSDGITWVARATPAAVLFSNGNPASFESTYLSVAYGNGVFVAVSSDSGQTNMMTSPDGVTWTALPALSGVQARWTGRICYGGSKFVAVSSSGSIGPTVYNALGATSIDGTTWTVAPVGFWTSPFTVPDRVFWTGTAYLVGGQGNQLGVSSDGVTWSQINTSDSTDSSNQRVWTAAATNGTVLRAFAESTTSGPGNQVVGIS